MQSGALVGLVFEVRTEPIHISMIACPHRQVPVQQAQQEKEKIMQILTAQELHNLAMNIVGEKLEKMGF